MLDPVEIERNGKHDVSASAAEQRVVELEREVSRLKAELAELKETHAVDRACLISHIIDDLPKSEEEFLRLAREGPTFRELLDELGFTQGLVEAS